MKIDKGSRASITIRGYFEFNDYINVSSDVLDKTFSCQTDSCRLYISFPRINFEEKGNCLGWPKIDTPTNGVQLYKGLEMQWGNIIRYSDKPNDTRTNVRIIYITAEQIGTNLLTDEEFGKMVDERLKTFAEHIYIKYPDAIYSSDEVVDRDDYGHSSYMVYHNSVPVTQNSICIDIPALPTYSLSSHDVSQIVEQMDMYTTLPYLICDNARRQYHIGDNREVILNCAMAIEVAIKKELRNILQNSGIGEALIDYTINKADGLPKLAELAKLLHYNIVMTKKLKDNIFNLRNRVIHAGCSVTREQTKRCLETARCYLLKQPIAMFEN